MDYVSKAFYYKGTKTLHQINIQRQTFSKPISSLLVALVLCDGGDNDDILVALFEL
jgi:hypothetical protein